MASGFVNSAASAARPLLLKDTFRFDQARLGVFMSAIFFGNALLGLQLGRITSALGGALPTVVRRSRQWAELGPGTSRILLLLPSQHATCSAPRCA